MAAAENIKPLKFADCYVLTPNRTTAFIHSFLQTFLPLRQEYEPTYTLPQFSETPEKTFASAQELMEYLEQNSQVQYAFYWRNNEATALRGAMCFYTSDGQLIVGVFCESLFPETRIEEGYLQKLQQFCNSTYGLIEYETPAAEDTQPFLERVEAYKKQHPIQ
jgi:hypothetical protein